MSSTRLLRRSIQVSIFTLVILMLMCSPIFAFDYTQHENFGEKVPGDVVSFTVTPPGTVLTGHVVNPGGFIWTGGPASFTGTIPPDFTGTHNGVFEGTYQPAAGGGEGGEPRIYTWQTTTEAVVAELEVTIDIAGTSDEGDDIVCVNGTQTAQAKLIGPSGISRTVNFSIDPSTKASVTPTSATMNTGDTVTLTIVVGSESSTTINDIKVLAVIDADTVGEEDFTIIEVELGFQNSKMSSPKVIDPLGPPKNVRIGVIKEDSITFKAILTPEVTLENEKYNWTGEQTGIGPEISITFNNTGNKNETLTVLEVARAATTTVLYVPPPNKYLWAILNPFTWPTVQSLGDEALEWSPGHNGVGDAKRHAYWNVLMTVEINATDAEGASTAYERSNLEGGGEHNEIVMDMENNAQGRSIAGGLPPNPSRTVCQNAVISASNAGTLTILDDLTNSNEVGLLQSSNQ